MASDPNPLISTVPRPHPARTTAASYPVQDRIEARFADMDVNGHLNNVALDALHENTRATLNRRVFSRMYTGHARSLRIVTSTIVVHYLREAPWPATLQSAIGIGHIGRTSYVASTALFLDDACISLCDTVLVLLDDEGPTPIPHDVRAQLAEHQLSPQSRAQP
ncbi:MAG: acyl-CoA thioesterase [Actinomycetia bacterium]|nr:acyl-CoA thioesterase [Actinomycetes bacterium]MCH9702685.1 acyl-CoA thioesterase [Actinomycetes bacterium]MCH9760724.1 acyl-CoA thioesterase [Actinomycetes bacterium]